MAELADAADSKSAGLRPLGVRLPLPAPVLNSWRSTTSLNLFVGSKLKCPVFVASEMSGFKVVPSPIGLGWFWGWGAGEGGSFPFPCPALY